MKTSPKVRRSFLGLLVASAIGWSSAAQATPVLVDFTGSTSGNFPSVTVGPAGSTLTLSSGSSGGVTVSDFGHQSIGQGLAAFGSYLFGEFSTQTNSLSFLFGNDDQCCGSAPGDLAVLRLYSNGSLIGTSSVVMNRNDNIDQSINFSGMSFNSFSFSYENALGIRSGLAEVVDNISYSTVSAVPEASTWAMMLLGFGFIGYSMRKARRRTFTALATA